MHQVPIAVTLPGNGQDGSGERVFKQCGNIGDIGCFSFFSNKISPLAKVVC